MGGERKIIAVNIDSERVTRQDFLFARRLIKKAILVDSQTLRRVENVLKSYYLDLRKPLNAQDLPKGRKL